MNRFQKILKNIKNDKKKSIVLAACVLLIIAILILTILLCLYLTPNTPPAPAQETTPPVTTDEIAIPIVQVVAADTYMTTANQQLLPALREKLGTSAEISLVSPSEVSKDPCLTLYFGSSVTSPAHRFKLYSQIGTDGYSITLLSPNTAVAEFLSESGAKAAADALVGCVTPDKIPAISENAKSLTVYCGEGADLQHTLTAADAEFSAICVSAPNVDSHSVNALTLLLDESKADLVIFNGDLDCGAANRSELADAWETINEILKTRKIQFIYALSKAESLPEVMLCEVISSMDSCVGGGGVYTVCRENGEPLTAIIAASNVSAKNAEIASAINAVSPFWKNTTGKKFSLLAVFPDAPEGLSLTAATLCARGTLVSDTDADTAKLLNAALLSGADHLICGGAKNSYGVAEKLIDSLPDGYSEPLTPRMALCGSIGYREEGLGGRFELHNSLRGGVSFKATADSCAFSYVYTTKRAQAQ